MIEMCFVSCMQSLEAIGRDVSLLQCVIRSLVIFYLCYLFACVLCDHDVVQASWKGYKQRKSYKERLGTLQSNVGSAVKVICTLQNLNLS